jgi:trimethylamine---corrinoid protein Co-methyltransferase
MARPGLQGGQYRPLTGHQIRELHAASLAILENTGIQVENEEALALYWRGGARIEGDRVYIPPHMVCAALKTVPSGVLLAGRDAAHDLVLTERRVYAGTGGSPTWVLDPGAQDVRPATLSDLADLVRLADALDACDFVVIPLHPTDVPDSDVPVNRFYTAIAHSSKHVMGGCGSVEGARAVLELATMVAGSLEALEQRPFVSAITSWMVSPLKLDTNVTQILIEWCRSGLPVTLSSAPMAGSTSPVTLAGTLVQLHAEQLSGIVLTQLARPGVPILAGYVPGVADMRTGGYLAGAIEFGMMQAAAAQLAHYYGVPIYGSGGMTDAKLPDAQAGYEKMATLLLAAMGGCNFIHHAVGMMTNMDSTSLEQAVLDNDIVAMAWRVLRGISVSETALAVSAIDRVGPGGHYLMDAHTLRFMRTELLQPAVADRQSRAAWQAGSQADARDRAREQAARLLKSHSPLALPSQVDIAIRARFPVVL